jgi:predicted outer membrane repeat protein
MKIKQSIFCALVLIIGWQVSSATTIVVSNTNDFGTGSFRAAVANAVDGDTIRFNPALLANGSDTIKFTSSVSIFKKVVIKGLFSATDTLFFSGQNATRILVVDIAMSALGTKNIVLDSLALIDGNVGTQQGGCMYIGPGLDTLFLRNSVIRNGQAKFGGGIYCGTTTLSTAKPPLVIISDSKFQNNTATDYGGAYCSYFAELKTNNVRVTGNSSERGGGFYFHAEGVSELNNTFVYNNTATHSGGGFNAHFTDTVIVSNSLFESNTATNFGGGMYSSGKLDVHKTDVKQNDANTRGGGIYFGYYASTMMVDSCEIRGNSASFGAGVYSQSTLNINYSNFSNNLGGQGAGMYFTSAVIHVLGCTFSGNTGSTGGGIYSGQLVTLHVNKSTIVNNSASLGGGIYCYTPYSANSFSITNSTVVNNSAIFGGGVGLRTSATYPLNATFKSSVIANNGPENIRAFNDTITSLGYNVFGDSVVVGSIATDQLAISDSLLSFRPLGNYGGFTQTSPPNKGSVAINAGDPLDASSAQNRAVVGVRDAGAAELVGIYRDTITVCTQTTWYGTIYSTSGDYAKLLPNADTVATLNLTIVPFTTGVDVISSCSAYTWIDSITYTTSNSTATDTLVNSIGCDSIVTLNLTIIPPATGTDVVAVCESYTWTNGITYTASNNTATDTLMTALGCDSVVTLNLTIYPPSSGTAIISACETYTWTNGITYTASNNTATDTLVSSLGCDSIVTLNLTILSANSSTDQISACGVYTWIDGVTYTSNNNTATYTLVNAAGCDSVVTLDLTIHTVNVGVTTNQPSITANAANASYRWLDCTNNYAIIPGETAQVFTATANGSYAVEVTELGCIDTSVCTTISNIGLAENTSSRVLVYPNPAHDVLQISNLWPASVKRIVLINALGQEVRVLQTTDTQVHVNIEGLTPGVYFVHISTGENSYSEKIIVSKK